MKSASYHTNDTFSNNCFFNLNRKQYVIQHSVADTFIKYTQDIYCSVGFLRGTGMSLEFSSKKVIILR